MNKMIQTMVAPSMMVMLTGCATVDKPFYDHWYDQVSTSSNGYNSNPVMTTAYYSEDGSIPEAEAVDNGYQVPLNPYQTINIGTVPVSSHSAPVMRRVYNTSQPQSGSYSASQNVRETEHDLIVKLNKLQRERGRLKNGSQGKRYYQTSYQSQNNVLGHQLEGRASYYGVDFNGKATASGEIFNMNAMTAAHKTLAFGTKIRVTNLENGRSLVVKINDRGPFIGERILDLSKGAAARLGMIESGTGNVRVEVLS